jgi:RNA polymerase sigma factor (sigma-70 family)
VTDTSTVDDLLRGLAPQVVGAVVRRYGDFAAAEDAVQEALLAATQRWRREGVPDNPKAWLVTVAARRMTDRVRSDVARRRREELVAPAEQVDGRPAPEEDDTLTLLFMCCHPALTPASAIALTLRAVGGLTTREIATAFVVPEATMGQRISRAKQRIKESGVPFRLPAGGERAERLRSVLHVLYLMFNEGYTTSGGPDLARPDISGEAIRLARAVHEGLPDDPEVAGLLALMLLTEARRPARTGPSGELVPLDEQDRSRWDHELIAEGVALVTGALTKGAVGEYQLQAAVAAVHDEAARVEDTDWREIAGLYGLLERITHNPLVALNRAVAVAMVDGPAAGLALVDALGDRLAGHHRVDAVRAHLLERLGDVEGAVEHYDRAAARTTSLPEQRYLTTRAARLRARRSESGLN